MAARTSYAVGALAVGALAAVAVAVTALLVAVGGRAAEPPSARSPEPAPAVVLAEWDARRAQAWSDGDPAALLGLYADGSRAGARDTAMLRRYLARGLRVAGLQMQRLDVAVLSRTGRSLVLRVRDRLAGGRVVGAGVRIALPRDRVSVHRVSMVLDDGAWLVAEVLPVRPEPRPAPSRSPRR